MIGMRLVALSFHFAHLQREMAGSTSCCVFMIVMLWKIMIYLVYLLE